MFLHLRNIPPRLAAGGYLLHTGLQRWNGSQERAEGGHTTAAGPWPGGVYAAAAGAFPFLAKVPPTTFVKAVSVAEISVGAALLTPIVPNKAAGAVLTAFAGGLVTMYLRTPSLHHPGTVWPTPAGIAVSKDVWMLGIGLGLLAEDGCAGKT